MRIGITTRIVPAQGYTEPRDALAQAWAPFMRAALPEAAWMPIPNLGAAHVAAYCEAWGIDRLVLSGGDNIGVWPLRDETEMRLLDWARQRSIPLLGVCRGMQMLAHAEGTGLTGIAGHAGTHHSVGGTRTGSVNSYHALALCDCPSGYEVIARSQDGCIEAIRHLELPWQGWMWHPEREPVPDAADIHDLRSLFL